MRKFAAVPALALLLVTGCSAFEQAPPPAEAEPATASPTAAAVTMLTKKEACVELFGLAQDGPLFETIELLSSSAQAAGAGEPADPNFPDDAVRLHDELAEIQRQAPDDIVPLLEDFRGPLDEITSLLDGTHTGESADIDAFKVAGAELLNTCAVYDQSGL
ncbi:hypothetical protein [Arthrobacter caoxuetaonis]|uniref:Lipoprotein n=1 Tax=Arthrobacter caoxuetaonis TaxID=2886935 RepID=A0A9X1MFZ4_9MICC|nr:hypothetical protein [Arthrobacter caoxuetaonis]MCC3299348.1 hypothetical protein [Arthrobacter caoxuetaonis]USQ59159.1 hypothetical protein NF551_18810 [Arthrobacter caoxuetaonis]